MQSADPFNGSVPGQPYLRVRSIQVLYDQPNHAQVSCTQAWAVLTTEGEVVPLAVPEESFSFEVAPADMATAVPLIDPATGAVIPGQTVTHGQCMLSMLAVIRHQQQALAGR